MKDYHRTFNFEKFVKAVDSQLFREFLIGHKLDIGNVNLNDPEQVGNLFKTFPAEIFPALNEEIKRVNDLADRQAPRLVEIIKKYGIPTFQDNESMITKSLRVFLFGNPDAFNEAYDLYLYDLYSETMYRYRYADDVNGANSTGNFAAFEKAVMDLHQCQDEGEECEIRRGVAGGEEFFIIAHGENMKTIIEFLNKKLIHRTYRPARQEMIVFNRQKMVISVTSSVRGHAAKHKYAEIFGKHFLGAAKVPEMMAKEQLVQINPVRSESFYQPTKEIEKITIGQIAYRRKDEWNTFVLVKSKDVAASLKDMRTRLEYCDLVSIVLIFKLFEIVKEIPVLIKPPEHSVLKSREGKDIVEQYLKDKGVFLF